MINAKDIGRRVRKLFPGKSQMEIGKALGVSQRTVSDWQRGRSFPAMAEIEKISGATGCTLDWLLTGRESYPAEAHNGVVLPAGKAAIIEAAIKEMRDEFACCIKRHTLVSALLDAIPPALHGDEASISAILQAMGKNHDHQKAVQ